MTAIDVMCNIAKDIDKINTGYDQHQRWNFLKIRSRTLIPNKEGDCSSVCGGIAYLAGFLTKLETDFYTGNALQRMTDSGHFQAIPFEGLDQLKRGDFVLNSGYHMEFMYDDSTMFSANRDERGQYTGGQTGDQTGEEVYFKPKYIYYKGWDYILRPINYIDVRGTYYIDKNYNPGKFDASYIKRIQQMLLDKEYSIGTSGVDGDLGPTTFEAVRKYQEDHGLTVDGIPGPETLESLEGSTMANKIPISVQGVKVAPGTYGAYLKLRAAFKAATGFDLLITSGYRSYAEQKNLYDRWTGKKQPPFYAPSVARPGTSLHESGRALDVRDSGNSPGVTVANNVRSNWIRNNAARYGFSPAGYGFNEPWHIEYQGNPWSGSNSVASLIPNSGFTVAQIKDVQNRLIRLGYSVGSARADGSLGPDTRKAVKAFQKKFGLEQDGLPGPKTLAKMKLVELQQVIGAVPDGLKGRDTNKRLDAVYRASAYGGVKFPYGVKYTQSVVKTTKDGSWGPKSVRAHDITVINIQRALGLNQDGIFGPNTYLAVKNI